MDKTDWAGEGAVTREALWRAIAPEAAAVMFTPGTNAGHVRTLYGLDVATVQTLLLGTVADPTRDEAALVEFFGRFVILQVEHNVHNMRLSSYRVRNKSVEAYLGGDLMPLRVSVPVLGDGALIGRGTRGRQVMPLLEWINVHGGYDFTVDNLYVDLQRVVGLLAIWLTDGIPVGTPWLQPFENRAGDLFLALSAWVQRTQMVTDPAV